MISNKILLLLALTSSVSYAGDIKCEQDFNYELHWKPDLTRMVETGKAVMGTSFVGVFTKSSIDPANQPHENVSIRAEELKVVNGCISNHLATGVGQLPVIKVASSKTVDNVTATTAVQPVDDLLFKRLEYVNQKFISGNIKEAYVLLGNTAPVVKTSGSVKAKALYSSIIAKNLEDGILKVNGLPIVQVKTPRSEATGIVLRSFINNAYLNTGKIPVNLLLLDHYDNESAVSLPACPTNTSSWQAFKQVYTSFTGEEQKLYLQKAVNFIIDKSKPIAVDSDVSFILNQCAGG